MDRELACSTTTRILPAWPPGVFTIPQAPGFEDGSTISLRNCRCLEHVFEWSKTIGRIRQAISGDVSWPRAGRRVVPPHAGGLQLDATDADLAAPDLEMTHRGAQPLPGARRRRKVLRRVPGCPLRRGLIPSATIALRAHFMQTTPHDGGFNRSIDRRVNVSFRAERPVSVARG
jgi:hypothetical protein